MCLRCRREHAQLAHQRAWRHCLARVLRRRMARGRLPAMHSAPHRGATGICTGFARAEVYTSGSCSHVPAPVPFPALSIECCGHQSQRTPGCGRDGVHTCGGAVRGANDDLSNPFQKPYRVPDVPAEEAGLWKERRAHLRACAALFVARPVWAGNALREAVPGMTGAESDILLPRLAYLFRNGARGR